MASFSGVLRTVLIILLVYFAIKIIIRWFGPMILRYFMNKLGKRFEDQFKQAGHTYTEDRQKEKEGKVTIEKKPGSNRRKSNKKVGEYIDYEEID